MHRHKHACSDAALQQVVPALRRPLLGIYAPLPRLEPRAAAKLNPRIYQLAAKTKLGLQLYLKRAKRRAYLRLSCETSVFRRDSGSIRETRRALAIAQPAPLIATRLFTLKSRLIDSTFLVVFVHSSL